MEGKDINILLVSALLCWRRPARPGDALLAQLATPCQADTGTRSIFQHEPPELFSLELFGLELLGLKLFSCGPYKDLVF
jgi:hypothetical protein